ncbi:hypothetical protein, partial [Bifidobacterium aquikefiri]|uniref:hypothetical protein n=1 Tax=Bifidobacterium aquikefiri TaxID=1653207 RepID=UPI0039E9AEBB
DRIHSPRRPDPLSSRARAASRELSPLQASTAKIPRLAALARDDGEFAASMAEALTTHPARSG